MAKKTTTPKTAKKKTTTKKIAPVKDAKVIKPKTKKPNAKKPSKQKLIEIAVECCGIITDMARCAKASRRQMYRWTNGDPEIQQAIQDGRDQLVDLAKSALKKNIEAGREKSVIYVLGTLGRKEGFGNFIEVKDRSRLEDNIDELTDDQIVEMMADRTRRLKKAIE